MKRSNSNPGRPVRRRSFRGWLKRVTLPRKTDPEIKSGIFGVPLTSSIQYAKTSVGYIDDDGVKHTRAGSIPIVVAKCGAYLKKNGKETEGVFRISGSVKRVNALEFHFNQSASHYGLDFNWEGYTVHDAGNLLTRYLNKLPNSVIPFESYQAFRDVMSDHAYPDTEQRIDAFQVLIQDLCAPHQHLLLYLLDTLSLFASYASETKMSVSNLAAVFCPGILRHPDHNTPIDYKISQYVIEFLIEFQSLFTMQVLDKRAKKITASPTEDIPWLVSHQSLDRGSIYSEPERRRVLEDTDSRTVKERSLPQESTPQLDIHHKSIITPSLLVCALMCLLLASYEAYLLLSLQSLIEPMIFFFELLSYYNISPANELNDDTEEAIRQDEILMSEWRDLITRSWKTDQDECSSISSRFNEEEEEESSLDESDEDGFDPATLELYLLQYDQIKKDAALAKKLQHEEQKARDVNNPFVNEKAADNKNVLD